MSLIVRTGSWMQWNSSVPTAVDGSRGVNKKWLTKGLNKPYSKHNQMKKEEKSSTIKMRNTELRASSMADL